MRTLKLTKNKVAILDDEDYELFKNQKWTLGNNGYAYRNYRNGREPYLHRLILQAPKGIYVDHKNGDKLDNRRENIRLCTQRQNAANQQMQTRPKSSKYKGVYWSRTNNHWIAQIKFNGKMNYLGWFRTEHQAALVYDLWAKDIFGEFAKLNVQH